MLTNDIFKIDFNLDRYNSFKESQVTLRGDWNKRIKDRKDSEERAIKILHKPFNQLTPENLFVNNNVNNINKMGVFNLLDIDAIMNNGKIIKARFGQLIPSNTKYLFNRKHSGLQFNNPYFKKFKDNFDELMTAQNMEEIKKHYLDLIGIPGIRSFLPSLLLYLKNGKEYNIMIESFAKKLLKSPGLYKDDFSFYIQYNNFINTFKANFHLKPQEIDLILSCYNNPKYDKYANKEDSIKKITNMKMSQKNEIDIEKEKPNFINPFENYENLLKDINSLKADRDHKERAHESLVETFFINLGYVKHKDIQYRKGRIDISIVKDSKPLIVIEVKKDWNLQIKNKNRELQQAYNYALENGSRYIILTNGDYYLFLDRLKGLSYSENIVGEFQLTNLKTEDNKIIQKLKKGNIFKSDLEEVFKNLSLCFK